MIVAGAVIAVDQLTKWWAESRLVAGSCASSEDACIDLIGTLRFHLVYNPGAAFSTGGDLGHVFGVIAMVMSVVLLRLAWQRTDRVGPVLLGAIAGGAVGNLIDRIARADAGFLSGEVVDFIDLQWWPVFNVADSAVVMGVIAFGVLAMFEPEPADGDDDGGAASDGEHSEPGSTDTAGEEAAPDDGSDAVEVGAPDELVGDLDLSGRSTGG